MEVLLLRNNGTNVLKTMLTELMFLFLVNTVSGREIPTIKDSLKDLGRVTGSIKYKFHREKPSDGRPFLDHDISMELWGHQR
jgi:hypothetical protein